MRPVSAALATKSASARIVLQTAFFYRGLGIAACAGVFPPTSEANRQTEAIVAEIADRLARHFSIVRADTPDLRAAAFRLRCAVYVEELQAPGFETWRFPDGEERDSYDSHSSHSLLRHRSDGHWAGVVRLVLAPPDRREFLFPVERAAGAALDKRLLAGVRRSCIGEISRLILAREFRRKPDEPGVPSGAGVLLPPQWPGDKRHAGIPFPVLGLLVATMQMTEDHGVTHWLATMEPRLARMLTMLGIEFTPIGPAMAYGAGGMRTPYLGIVVDVMRRLKSTRPSIWTLLNERRARRLLLT